MVDLLSISYLHFYSFSLFLLPLLLSTFSRSLSTSLLYPSYRTIDNKYLYLFSIYIFQPTLLQLPSFYMLLINFYSLKSFPYNSPNVHVVPMYFHSFHILSISLNNISNLLYLISISFITLSPLHMSLLILSILSSLFIIIDLIL